MLLILWWNKQAWQQSGSCHLLFGETGNHGPSESLHTKDPCTKMQKPAHLGHFSGLCLQWANLRVSPIGQRAVLLTACYKMVGSPSLAFLSCNAIHFVCKHPSGPICFIPVRIGVRNPTQTCWHCGYCFCCKSFIYDPVLSCALSAPMKLWQANVLACKEGKISDSSQFLILTSWVSLHN